MSQVVRHPYMIGVREQAKFKDTYGGEPGWAFIEGMQIRPEDRESNAHGERNARNTHVPTLVVGNGADSACTPSHTHRLYEAIPHADKEIFEIEGTSHYYMGQRDELLQCIEIYSRWLRAHDLDD
jgi:pimeloyl-ACP methyl ester carboxylesterase